MMLRMGIHDTLPLVDRIYFVLPSFSARPIFADFDSTERSADILHSAPNDVNVVGVRKQLHTLVENSAIALHSRLP